jgi:hypothetical protein
MRCERCGGTGQVEAIICRCNHLFHMRAPDGGSTVLTISALVTCPDCGGCGIVHCCEGEWAQLEAPRNA